MIDIVFSEKEIESLNYERFHHPHPRVQLKMEVLYLKSQGLKHKEITKISRISSPTLCRYLKEYNEGGIEKLREINFYRPESELIDYKDTIESYFKNNPPATIREAQAKIKELTGIKRSEPQVRKFLLSVGIERRKVGVIPAKADVEEQETFKKKS